VARKLPTTPDVELDVNNAEHIEAVSAVDEALGQGGRGRARRGFMPADGLGATSEHPGRWRSASRPGILAKALSVGLLSR
jgi:hypothetical protein